MSLLPLFDRSLIGRAAFPALEYDAADGSRREATFGDLEVRSNQLAHALGARGLKTGDRVACFLANGIEFIDLWIASAKLGLVVVPINVLYREHELTRLLRDADPLAVITSRSLASMLPRGSSAWEIETLSEESLRQSRERPVATLTAGTPMALLYTSGTTGEPKGAVLTHGNFAVNGLSLVAAWKITGRDRYLAALPLFHANGLANGLHLWLFGGCHLRLLERFDHAKAAQQFLAYRPTIFLGVPTMFIRLLEVPADQAATIGARLRLAVSGSAALSAEVHEQFRARYGTAILERYGTSETLGIAANPYDGERRVGSVGLPFEHVAVKICDDAGQAVADGTSGELWVNGPNVCAGYWRRPQATAASWRDGWFRTGDIAVRGRDGYLTLQGRRSHLIISGGFKIDPREIEEVLLEQPGVREAMVLPAPDAVRGEVPIAYVVVDPASYDESVIMLRLRSQIASFKQPRALVRLDSLPRTVLGKLPRRRDF